MKSPYTFPHRSRKAMIEYLMDRRTYADHYTPYVFEWNVKAHSVNYDRPKGEHELDSALDDDWRCLLDSYDEYGPVYAAFENACRTINNDEWCSYPGDDQGDWQFYFAGRHSGHIVLRQWCGHVLGGRSHPEIRYWLESLETETLRKFYRGIRTADSDFTPAKAAENVEFFLNDERAQWESELKAEREARAERYAAQMMESRPDMYETA